MGKMIAIHQQMGKIDAYMAFPEKRSAYGGAVILVHEIWGLTTHIKDVADRIAGQGYMVIAPDLYSSTMADRKPSEELQSELFSHNERERYNAQPKLRALIAPTQTPQFTSMALGRLQSCFEYVYNQPLVHQRVMLVGFGMGGNYTFSMAIRESRLKGVIAFYGHCPYLVPELSHITCPVLAFFGQKELAMIKEQDIVIPRMRKANVDYRPVIYAQTGHAFFNDANPFAYQPASAKDAWNRMVDFMHNEII